MSLDSMWVAHSMRAQGFLIRNFYRPWHTYLQVLLALPPIQLSVQAGCTPRQNLEDFRSKERQHLPALISAIVASGCSIKTKTKGKLCRANLRRKQTYIWKDQVWTRMIVIIYISSKDNSLNYVQSNLRANYLFSFFHLVGIVQHGGHLRSDKYITFSNIHVHYA